MHLDQHRHVQPQGNGRQIGHSRVVQASGDEQNAVGAHGTRLVNLVRVDHEVFAQHRQLARSAGLLQKVGLALEKLTVGQHRQTSRAMFGITLRNVSGHKVGTQHAFGRAGFFHLGNHRGLPRCDLGAHGTQKVAGEHARLGVCTHRSQ